mmetsp:Transcript_25106/g.56458  ORF Transcript_25106/g.56458 Transcript_25106/m.56458 type:complete len:204 (-) Transcript_25106:1336-1947(-)
MRGLWKGLVESSSWSPPVVESWELESWDAKLFKGPPPLGVGFSSWSSSGSKVHFWALDFLHELTHTWASTVLLPPLTVKNMPAEAREKISKRALYRHRWACWAPVGSSASAANSSARRSFKSSSSAAAVAAWLSCPFPSSRAAPSVTGGSGAQSRGEQTTNLEFFWGCFWLNLSLNLSTKPSIPSTQRRSPSTVSSAPARHSM